MLKDLLLEHLVVALCAAFTVGMARVTIHGCLFGEQYCHAGPATAQNGWTVDGSWQVKDLLGHMLIRLDDAPGGSKSLKRDHNGALVITAKVAGVVMHENYLADQYMTLVQAADTQSRVLVVFGDEVLPYRGAPDAETVPCADDDGISTPSTPLSLPSSH